MTIKLGKMYVFHVQGNEYGALLHLKAYFADSAGCYLDAATLYISEGEPFVVLESPGRNWYKILTKDSVVTYVGIHPSYGPFEYKGEE